MPSPWYACTVPPYSSTARLIIVTHSPTSTLASSGSSRSPSAVEPTMSAKRTVTGRRSSCVLSSEARPSGLGPARPGWPARAARWRERLVLAQDRLLELSQLGAGLEPELVVEALPVRAVALERVGLRPER